MGRTSQTKQAGIVRNYSAREYLFDRARRAANGGLWHFFYFIYVIIYIIGTCMQNFKMIDQKKTYFFHLKIWCNVFLADCTSVQYSLVGIQRLLQRLHNKYLQLYIFLFL